MNNRRLLLLAGVATLFASLAIDGIAEAGPIGGNVAPTEVQPTANDKTKGKKANGRASGRLIAGPGTKPADGVLAPRPDHSSALKHKPHKPVMADLSPGQVMRMSVGSGIELADGIAAGVSAEGGLFTTGSLFGNQIEMRSHAPGNLDDTLQIVLLPESATQVYNYEIAVGNGMFDVSVDAYWVNDTSAGGVPVDHDELLAVGKLRSYDGKLHVTINPDPSWKVGPTAYYVFVSREGADWSFRGASIFRAT